MAEYKEIIKQLEAQNALPDTTNAQRECNNHRISWLNRLHKAKPSTTETVFYDAVQQRLAHGYSITPNALLHD
jgi:hypothetical protein